MVAQINQPESFRLTIFGRKEYPLNETKENLTGQDAFSEGTKALKDLLEGKIGGLVLTEEFKSE